MLQKRDAAVRVGIARRVVRMSAQIQVAVVVFIDALRKAGRRGKHQTVAERNVCRDFAAIFRNLLPV